MLALQLSLRFALVLLFGVLYELLALLFGALSILLFLDCLFLVALALRLLLLTVVVMLFEDLAHWLGVFLFALLLRWSPSGARFLVAVLRVGSWCSWQACRRLACRAAHRSALVHVLMACWCDFHGLGDSFAVLPPPLH